MPDDLDKPNIGDEVVLVALPHGLFDDLPDEDQRAIASIVGKPVRLTGWEDGRAVLDFPEDARSGRHYTIWVPSAFVARQRE